MKKNNKNNNHKLLSKNYIKGALSGALALTILCSGVGVAAYSAGADNLAQTLGVQTGSTVEAVKKSSTTKEALKKLSKNETVYVIADASGSAKKIIVSDWLKGVSTNGKVKDVSNLKDVKNVKGDETYTVNEDNAYEWAAKGDDIYYQGTGTTELPVKLKLSYKLNGKTVSADEIAGKSGKVTIRIDYENTQKEKVKINGKTEEVNVPFLMLSGMILDDDNFKNVEVSNGKAINDGTRTIVAGFALPGMQDSLDIDKDKMEIPDYVEITADATNFELSTTMTVAINDIFNNVDFSKVDDKVDELKDSLDELEDAADQLVDGSSQLYDGIGTLLDKSGTLIEGIDKLYDGAEQVSSGAKQLDSGAGDLSNGAKTLDDGASKLKSGASQLDSGASQLDSGLATLAGGASQVDNGAASLSSYVATLAGGLGKLSSNSSTLNSGAEQVFNTLLSTADTQIAAAGLTADKLTIKNYASVLDSLISSLSDENAQKLAYNTALETVTATVNSQKDVIRTAVEATVRKSVTEQVLAAAGLGMTADQYDAAVAAGQVSEEVQAQVSTAVSTQMSSSAVQATIDSNTEAQIQSLIETNMNSEEVQSQIQAGVAKAQSGRKSLQALKTQLDSYNTFYQGVLSYTAGVDQANEGAQQILAGTYTLKDGTGSLVSGAGQLKSGSSSLKSGTSELKSGTSTLKDGTSSLKSGAKTLKNGTSSLSSGAKSLFDGVGTLKDGSAALVDGVKKLNDGAMTLSKGMKKFKEEGIDSIVDAANGDVKDIIDRFKAVQKASKKYNNYSGISDDMDGKVDFIYKTDSIEKK